jgi:hypothetical protein
LGYLGGSRQPWFFGCCRVSIQGASSGTMTRSRARFVRRSYVGEATASCAQERFRTCGWSGTRRLAPRDPSSHWLGLRKERTWLLRYAFQPHSEA